MVDENILEMSDLKKEAHVGNKINLAQLAALIFQGAVLVWGASALNSSVANQQKQLDGQATQLQAVVTTQSALDSRISKMEGVMTYQTKVLDNINEAVMSRRK